MLEGTALIARHAAKKRAKDNKRVVVHAVATRYSFPFDVQSVAAGMLDQIKARLTYAPSRGLQLHGRVRKVGEGLLALEGLPVPRSHPGGHDRPATPQAHRRDPQEPMESEWVNGNGGRSRPWCRSEATAFRDSAGHDQGRARRSRTGPAVAAAGRPGPGPAALSLSAGLPDHGASNGRIIETIKQFEEDLTGKITVHGPVEAKVTVGDAIEVGTGREARDESDPLMAAIEAPSSPPCWAYLRRNQLHEPGSVAGDRHANDAFGRWTAVQVALAAS